jgi:hypothetical protein
MRRRQHALLLLAGPFSVTACALVAGLGDRTLGDPNAGQSSTESHDGGGSPAPTTTTTATTTATTLLPEAAPTGPSYCTGIVLYAAFDTKVTGSLGWPNADTAGTVTNVASGKFGGGVQLIHDATNRAALFLLTSPTNPWPVDTGSLAVWYRQAPGTVFGADNEVAPVLYRPVGNIPATDGDPVVSSGLAFYLLHALTSESGLYFGAGSAETELLTVAQASMDPYLRPNDFNHYFTAWNRVTTGPTAFWAINGGLGVQIATGVADPPPPDPSQVAQSITPFKAFTNIQWASDGPAIALRLGGMAFNNPDGVFDDLVVWNRVLTFQEAAAVYQATSSVGTTCGLAP